MAVEYVWIEGGRNAHLQNRRELLNNKDWEAGIHCLESEMGSSWW